MSWTKNALLLLLSTVAAILLFEIVLSFTYKDNNKFARDLRDHTDSYIPKPREGIYKNAYLGTSATFDSNGIRLNPFECIKKESSYKVLIVGDSNIEGSFLNDNEAIGSQITRLTKDSKRCLKVDSFGVSGFGPDQSYQAVKKLTKLKKYDHVVFHFFADNDLGDLLRNRTFIRGEFRNMGYCFPQKNILDRFLIIRAFRKAFFNTTGYYLQWNNLIDSLGDHESCKFAISPRLNNFAESMMARARLDKEIFNQSNRQIYMTSRYDIEFACNSDIEAIDYSKSALKKLKTDMFNLSKKEGFKLFYLIQPSEFDVTNNHKEYSDSIKELCSSNYQPSNLSNIYIEIFQDQNIIDLYKGYESCSECYFSEQEFGNDNHWSPIGVEKAAFQVIESIFKSLPIQN
tara:strand:- start:433 stop:1635 length:1203 start_codon:yes stop_codon:yes gene_type:complete